MPRRKRIKIEGHIMTAWAEACHGPGWANQPVWVLVKDDAGALKIECIQPEDQTAAIGWLFRISEAAHKALRAAVIQAVQ